MRLIRLSGVLPLAFVLVPAIAIAQTAPVAVPIVGSPAAQPRPAQPPQIPTQPPPMPPQLRSPSPAVPAGGARKLQLSLAAGTIALEAENVTLREILAEWHQRSGCEFVNADKLPSSPVTLQFPAGTPELEAIDSLLRGLATPTSGYGYIVAPRDAQAGDSSCRAVYIVPTSRPTASASYAPPVASPIAAPIMAPGAPDDEIPPVVPFPPGAPPGRPGVPPGQPNVPGQFIPNTPPGQAGQPTQPPAQPGSTGPGAPASNFGPIAPTAPGAGRVGAQPQPPTPAPGSGRGGQ